MPPSSPTSKLLVQAHLVEIVQRRGKDEALCAEQQEQGKFTQAGHKGQKIAAYDRRLLDRDDDPDHSLDPGSVLDDGCFFQFVGELEHGVQRTS